MHPFDLRIVALALTAAAVAHGTLYSIQHATYLDTSHPLLTAQPHPLAATHALASKRSLLNVLFLKWAWAWTSAAFAPLLLTAPARRTRRAAQWALATAAWAALTGALSTTRGGLLARVTAATGGECGLHIGRAFVPIAPAFCAARTRVSRATHPALFPAVFPDAEYAADPARLYAPRLRAGHDVSGHVFLLTLGALFLADQLRHAQRRGAARGALLGAGALFALWVFSLWVTSVYFHAPAEKASGFVLGVAAFALSQLPLASEQTRPRAR
ncbi:inositol phospholipid synthesis and fat-storage-inducing TM-domain-containing protein [Gloeopeniophorella convolvens]|nr:inositol phospholipid synthesis and fat-storage-inducing TM-domain-containing protein [Gloeopeniophorella convolvens]